jgi:hypothetical protein
MRWLPWQCPRQKKRHKIEYGLHARKVQGYLYYADGFIQGFPFKYRIVALPLHRGEPSEDTTILNKQIIADVLRLERREPSKRAIYALFYYQPPNFVIKFSAFTSKGKEIPLLDEGVYISVPGRHTATLLRMICEGLVAIANGMQSNTKGLDFISQRLMREALLYSSQRTNQFWISATVTAYVSLITSTEQ